LQFTEYSAKSSFRFQVLAECIERNWQERFRGLFGRYKLCENARSFHITAEDITAAGMLRDRAGEGVCARVGS